MTGFETYISTYPRSEMTDDAAFYIGETYFLQGDFQDAVEAYEQVVLNYSNGDKVPEAAYKRGLALDRLGEPERARESFRARRDGISGQSDGRTGTAIA